MSLFKPKYNGLVKILKEGKLPWFGGKCTYCGCMVSAKHGSHPVFGISGGQFFMTIKCPTPGCKCFISAEKKD